MRSLFYVALCLLLAAACSSPSDPVPKDTVADVPANTDLCPDDYEAANGTECVQPGQTCTNACICFEPCPHLECSDDGTWTFSMAPPSGNCPGPDEGPLDVGPAPCPDDYQAANGTACANDGQSCNNCGDPCTPCWIISCEGGTWQAMESFPPPDACTDAGPTDAEPTDAGPTDKGTGPSDTGGTTCPEDPFAAASQPCDQEEQLCNYPVTEPVDCGGSIELLCTSGAWFATEIPGSSCIPTDEGTSLDQGPAVDEGVPSDEGASIPENCEELLPALMAELSALQACTEDAECGQEIPGTSCGCTRNKVARLDAELDHFFNLLATGSFLSCSLPFMSTCDCPAADGFICEEGVCNWNYLNE